MITISLNLKESPLGILRGCTTSLRPSLACKMNLDLLLPVLVSLMLS